VFTKHHSKHHRISMINLSSLWKNVCTLLEAIHFCIFNISGTVLTPGNNHAY
jgi:hypothetical protein